MSHCSNDPNCELGSACPDQLFITKFTNPDELFSPWTIPELKHGRPGLSDGRGLVMDSITLCRWQFVELLTLIETNHHDFSLQDVEQQILDALERIDS